MASVNSSGEPIDAAAREAERGADIGAAPMLKPRLDEWMLSMARQERDAPWRLNLLGAASWEVFISACISRLPKGHGPLPTWALLTGSLGKAMI